MEAGLSEGQRPPLVTGGSSSELVPIVLGLHLDPPEEVVGLGALATRLVIAIERVEEHVQENTVQRAAFVAREPPGVHFLACQR